jgi:hypothetical protein
LVSFFDFIVAANGTPFSQQDDTFLVQIKESEEKPLPLTVYNCKNHTTRELVLVPSSKWAGQGKIHFILFPFPSISFPNSTHKYILQIYEIIILLLQVYLVLVFALILIRMLKSMYVVY